MSNEAIVGVTYHDFRHLALQAVKQDADYIAFGAFPPTTTRIQYFKPRPISFSGGKNRWKARASPLATSPRITMLS